MPREPYHEISDLLRSHKPDPRPSPGLEARIVNSLRSPEPSANSRIWPWFLLPPAVAAGIVLLWPQPAALPPIARQTQVPSRIAAPPVPADFERNPLERETLALQNDARRAGRFLIDCLPALTTPGE